MTKKKKVAHPETVAHETFPTPIALGIKAFALTGTFIFSVQMLRGSAQSEGPDRAIFLFSLLMVGIFLRLGFSNEVNLKREKLYGFLALVAIFIGIAGIEQHGGNLSNIIWLGFGPYVLLLTILYSLIAFRVVEWFSLSKIWKSIFSILITIDLIFVVLSIWQDSSSIIDPHHSEYILNEIFAQSVGLWPYSDFIPQYQSFYGFLLQPFVGGMTAIQISEIALVGLSILSLLTLAIGTFIAWIAIDRRSIFLAIGLVIPFTAVTPFPIREQYLGSISALLSGLPIRILPGLITIGLVIWIIRRSTAMNGKSNLISLICFGYFSALVMWHSQDFGVAAVFTCYLILAFAGSRKFVDLRLVGKTLFGFVPGFATYPILAALAGKEIHMEYFLFFSRQFGSGFGSERMRTPGPVLIILPLIVLLLVIHGIYVYRSKKNLSVMGDYSLNSLIGFAFALWCLFGFTYYLNRSYASGQMQIILLPLAISLAALIGILLKEPTRSSVFGNYQNRFLFSPKSIKERNFPWVFPLLLIISLPFASMLLSPNPKIELKRLNQVNSELGWPKPSIIESVADASVAASYAEKNGLSIAYFGASSNFVMLETGVNSALIFNSPFDLTIPGKAVQTACNYLDKLDPDVLVLSSLGLQFFQFEGKTLCNVYIQQDIPGVRSGHFAVKVSK